MLIIRLIRFLRGYICFAASEGFPERFLNLCNRAGAAVWEIDWSGEAMRGKTDRCGFALMQDCTEPAGVKLEVLRQVGLPFFLHSYRQRAGMLAGLAVCIVTLTVLSGRIWTIEVAGNNRVETAQILQAAMDEGVRQGARRKDLIASEINGNLLQKLSGVSWISVNIRGTSAVIEVREELPLDTEKDDTPQDIIARKTGQLRALEIYSGKPHAGVGDTVLEGGVIAGGAIENADKTMRYVRAQAYAAARTYIEATVVVPRKESVSRVEIAKTQYAVHFLNVRIPLGRQPKIDTAVEWAASFVYAPQGKAMPLALERVSFVVYPPQERTKSDVQLRLSAAERLFDEGFGTLRTAQFLRQEVAVELGEDVCAASLAGSAYENVGVERAAGEKGGD